MRACPFHLDRRVSLLSARVGRSFLPRFASAVSQLRRRPRRHAAAAVRSSSNASPGGVLTLPA